MAWAVKSSQTKLWSLVALGLELLGAQEQLELNVLELKRTITPSGFSALEFNRDLQLFS